MRKVRYAVATSADGFIAGPDGSHDWIVMDPDIDFPAFMASFDTILMGRKTYEIAVASGRGAAMPGMKTFVCSRSLDQKACPGVTLAKSAQDVIAELRKQPGKDIWLFGGGSLFSSLLEAGWVDGIELTVIPVLLGQGLSLAPALSSRSNLELIAHRAYPKTGTITLEYSVRTR